MKKACAYLVFFILLLNSTFFQQLFKIPFLVEHFIEHQQRDKNVGLLDFFSMHYWGKDINDHDEEKDQRLPFKTFDDQTIQPLFYPGPKGFFVKTIIHFYKVDFPFLKDPFLPDPNLSSLFRPPRIVSTTL